MAQNVMEQLRTNGKVTRAQLGVTVQPVTSDMAESLGLKQVGGAIVSSVTPGSAAERAGIKRGDVIESFNGQPVHDTNTLRNRVAEAAPGSTADVVIVRDGTEKHADGEARRSDARRRRARPRRQRAGASDDKAALGVSVAPLTPELARARSARRRTRTASSSRTSTRTAARRTPASRRATSSRKSIVSR